MDYVLHVFTLVAIYCILATSLNLVAGYAGMLSVTHAAFYGMGAYSAGLASLYGHVSFPVSVVIGAIVGGIGGAIAGVPLIRVRGEGIVVATFAFQVLATSLLTNLSVTGGPGGLSGIGPPTLLGWQITGPVSFSILALALAIAVFVIAARIVQSPLGRVLRAIREDDVFVSTIGRNAAAFRLLILTIGASMAGVAGALYAQYVSFIDPTSFTVMESIFVISIVIVGGAGSLWGPVIGAIVLVTLPEVLRFIGLPSAVAANVRQILYGAALVACMMWRPQGLLGEYTFQKGGSRQ